MLRFAGAHSKEFAAHNLDQIARAVLASSCASTHDSFNASSLGAFIQSPLKARGGEIEERDYMLFTVTSNGTTLTIRVWQDNDTTSEMASTDCYLLDSNGDEIDSVPEVSTVYTAQNLFDGTDVHADANYLPQPFYDNNGYTLTRFAGSTSLLIDDIDAVRAEVRNGSVIYEFTLDGFFISKTVSPATTKQYITTDPQLWSGPYAADNNDLGVFRWAYIDPLVVVVAGVNFAIGSTAWRWNFDGGSQFAQGSLSFSTVNFDFMLATGGTWPNGTPRNFVGTSGVIASEPAVMTSVEHLNSPNQEWTGLSIDANYRTTLAP